MGRFITAVVAVAALSFLAYRVLYTPKAATAPQVQKQPEPQRALQNVRTVGERIEGDDKAHLDDIDKKTQGP